MLAAAACHCLKTVAYPGATRRACGAAAHPVSRLPCIAAPCSVGVCFGVCCCLLLLLLTLRAQRAQREGGRACLAARGCTRGHRAQTPGSSRRLHHEGQHLVQRAVGVLQHLVQRRQPRARRRDARQLAKVLRPTAHAHASSAPFCLCGPRRALWPALALRLLLASLALFRSAQHERMPAPEEKGSCPATATARPTSQAPTRLVELLDQVAEVVQVLRLRFVRLADLVGVVQGLHPGREREREATCRG